MRVILGQNCLGFPVLGMGADPVCAEDLSLARRPPEMREYKR